jgi:hypothetical protein
MLGSGGGTKQSERAVAAALNWIARHQLSNGSWTLNGFQSRCKKGDTSCTGSGKAGERPAAATAMALLPYLAAGQTHKSKGPYQRTIASGIQFLIAHQNKSKDKLNGDLRMGDDLYDHGLASIALCECYGMTGDKEIKNAAQAALDFIMESQDPQGGGWRYRPGRPGDISVTGWQVMALKSGEMAYLTVDPAVLEKAKKFVISTSFDGEGGGRFAYQPGNMLCDAIMMPGGQMLKNSDTQRAVTAIGLLCQQYMHMPRNDPAMIEGTAYLLRKTPDTGPRNIYYWYYATQVMHNQPGPDWDKWNRKMRRILIDTQNREGCASGSWDPVEPSRDLWGDIGGRLMMTSLSALTLEVYYRYLPLYKLDRQPGGAEPPGDKVEPPGDKAEPAGDKVEPAGDKAEPKKQSQDD